MIENYNFFRLNDSSEILPFDCDRKDLNEFLFDDAKEHLKELLAVTYIVDDSSETLAYFSVLNDSVRETDTSSKSRYKKLLGLIPYKLRIKYKSHPAVKVGRFAVNKRFKRQGIGSELMDYIKGYFLDNNKTGCRFILVDAINEQEPIAFYRKNGFDFLTPEDEKEENRLMFFDLITYTPLT